MLASRCVVAVGFRVETTVPGQLAFTHHELAIRIQTWSAKFRDNLFLPTTLAIWYESK